MRNKSSWSGRSSGSLVEISKDLNLQGESIFVEQEYKEQLIAYLNFSNKWKNVFLALVLSLSCVIAIVALVAPPWAIGACLVVLGAVLIVLPLPTPQTIQLLGVKKSILLVRAIAILIVGAGIWLSFK